MNYYLKAASHEELYLALATAGLLVSTYNETGEVVSQIPASGVSLDIIGTIYAPTNVMDVEGNPIMAALIGYHANMIAELTPEQETMLPLIAQPINPVRVWA